jgi:hypothetical protein
LSRLRGLGRSGGPPTRVNIFERWDGPEDLAPFRASGDPDDETVDFSRIRRFEIEQYRIERRI